MLRFAVQVSGLPVTRMTRRSLESPTVSYSARLIPALAAASRIPFSSKLGRPFTALHATLMSLPTMWHTPFVRSSFLISCDFALRGCRRFRGGAALLGCACEITNFSDELLIDRLGR